MNHTFVRAYLFLGLVHTANTQDCDGMTVLNDTSCTQTAFKWTNETSALDCCAACVAVAKCSAWEYASVSKAVKKGNCHLKTSPGPHEAQTGTTCGFKPPPPPPPTPAPPPAPAGAPNIVFFLTDDQDQILGSSFPVMNDATPMPKTQALMADKGSTATSFYIHTPICCPSRSELLVVGTSSTTLKRRAAAACTLTE